ncbi:MAG TPA: pyrroloquinoline quinone biosynthesis protein PqqB [Polyangia bacterium]
MRVRILGSAAGGGAPQWNCGCTNCRGIRTGELRAVARRQESVAVSGDGHAWVILNASPEIRAQVESFRGLWPRAPRHSPIAALVLTNGDLDHVLGLLSLRESHPLTVFATETVRRGFTEGNVLYRTLERFEGQVTWRRFRLGEETALAPGLTVIPFAVPGKRPIHLELGAPAGASGGAGDDRAEDSIGLSIRGAGGGGSKLVYVSAAAAWTPEIEARASGADAVFFDGTFWSSDELIAAGLGTKRAEEMAHLPIGGPGGGLERLARLDARRKILIHINNTNPILRDDSPERAAVVAAGVEVAHDDMELEL